MSSAAEEKLAGTTAWSEGNFSLAVEHFTKAIEVGGDSDFLKVLYSNRSAAYLKQNKASEALLDANKCIELDSNWIKGFSRKGDALLFSKRYTEAYNAYNAGLRLSPNDTNMMAKAEQAMRAIRHSTAQSSSNSARGASTVAAGPSSAIEAYGKVAIIVLAILYLLPFGRSYRSISYRLAAAASIGLSGMALFKKYGMPKFSTEYAARVMPDPNTMEIFLGSILIMSQPYFFAILPVCLRAMMVFTPQILKFLRQQLPQVQASLDSIIARFAPSLKNINITQMLSDNNTPLINTQLIRGAAACEMYQGVLLVVELLLPSRNIIQLYIWWQYLRMRCMIESDGHLKNAFRGLDVQISQLLEMRLCPGVVRKGYAMLKTYLAKQIEQPTANSQEQPRAATSGGLAGMLSKCTVM